MSLPPDDTVPPGPQNWRERLLDRWPEHLRAPILAQIRLIQELNKAVPLDSPTFDWKNPTWDKVQAALEEAARPEAEVDKELAAELGIVWP